MLHLLNDDFCAFPFAEEIKEAVLQKKNCILLVPEQMALANEKHFATLLPPDAPLYFEVSNFSRLADRVFRSEGGISYLYADRAAEMVLMWKILTDAAPYLSSKKKTVTPDAVREKLAALQELTASGTTVRDLKDAAHLLNDNQTLQNKISDLALIAEIYEGETFSVYGSLSKDLDKLCDILKKKPLFADTVFFVSGFTSFTKREMDILGELIRTCSVSVALSLPENSEIHLCYEETKKTYATLLKWQDDPPSSLPTLSKSRPFALQHAKEHLFRADGVRPPQEDKSQGLTLLLAENPYDASARIAAEIAKKVRDGGYRYRDFAVVTRAADKYDGILDSAFAAYGIPYFFSKNTNIHELSLPKMILAAYASIRSFFRLSDVIAYMKCGFSGIDADACDLFEMYVSFWHLHGKAFSEDIPFDMHPRGYESVFTPYDEKVLSTANAVRKALLSPLWQFQRENEKAKTAKDFSLALHHFLRELHTEETLLYRAKEERLLGRADEADRLCRLTEVIYGLTARIVDVMGDLPLSCEQFSELLSLLFSTVSLGTLPTAQDAVTVSEATAFRPQHHKTVYLLGANENEFPAALGTAGAFSDEERTTLEKLGFPIGVEPSIRASREQFCFLRALCGAEENATVIAFKNDALGASIRPSSAFTHLSALFPKALRTEQKPPEIFTRQNAVEQLTERKGTKEGEAIAALLAEDPAYASMASLAKVPIFDPTCQADPSLAEAVFPKNLRTTQSRIDRFLDCPFSYYCHYVLRLSDDKKAGFHTVEIGTVMHAILEGFFEKIAAEGHTIHTIDPQRIPAYIEEACSRYVAAIFPDSMKASPRLHHLFLRLRRAATLVARDLYDEFMHSKFEPKFCELSIGEQDTPEALVFRDAKGNTVSLYGRIDRTDIYRDQDGRVYVRVVDYKTGTHKFSRDELKKGRNMQMFVYLCAIWKSQNQAFLSRIACDKDNPPLPAAILYSTANPALPKLDAPEGADLIEQRIRKKNLSRNGFYLQEDAILAAMDDTYKTRLPAKHDKNSFGTLVDFGEMLDDTEDAVLSVASRMRGGHADIAPDTDCGKDVCKFCAFRPICRREDT